MVGSLRFFKRVNTAESLQFGIDSTLRPDAQTVDAKRSQGAQLVLVGRRGIALDRDLCVVRQRVAGADGVKQRDKMRGG